MKTIYLVRHGKSSWDNLELKDFDRPLKTRGIKNATELGRQLNRTNHKIEAIWSSPAVRAEQTAKLILQQLKQNKLHLGFDENLYEADFGDLFRFITNLDSAQKSIMIVGHEPTLSDFINYFLTEPMGKLVTASMTTLKFNCKSWKEIDPTRTLSVHHKSRHDWVGYMLH